MINPIEEQRELIDQLYRVVKGSCPENFRKARCVFYYEKFDDGSSRVGQEFYFNEKNGEVSEFLDRELRRPVKDIVKDLHEKMQLHTGGDWNSFTLFINEDGSVTTCFDYPKN